MKVLVTLGIMKESPLQVPAGVERPEPEWVQIDMQAFDVPTGGYAHLRFPIKALAMPGINPRQDSVEIRIAPADERVPKGRNGSTRRGGRRKR